MKKIVMVQIQNMSIVGEKKSNFIWKPMVLHLRQMPQKPNEVQVVLVPPFYGLLKPGSGKFILPEGGYFISDADEKLRKLWQESTTGLKIPTNQEVQKIISIKRADK